MDSDRSPSTILVLVQIEVPSDSHRGAQNLLRFFPQVGARRQVVSLRQSPDAVDEVVRPMGLLHEVSSDFSSGLAEQGWLQRSNLCTRPLQHPCRNWMTLLHVCFE